MSSSPLRVNGVTFGTNIPCRTSFDKFFFTQTVGGKHRYLSRAQLKQVHDDAQVAANDWVKNAYL